MMMTGGLGLAAIVEYVMQAHRNEFILACSALKQSYRDYLGQRLNNKYLFLELSEEAAVNRSESQKESLYAEDSRLNHNSRRLNFL